MLRPEVNHKQHVLPSCFVEGCGLCCVHPPDILYEFTKGDVIGNKCIDSVRD
jgi:hypothetical protein